MELHEVFLKWKLNHYLFASFIGNPKGTFNNKLNPKYYGKLKTNELKIMKMKLKEMIADLDSVVKAYPVDDNEVFNLVDEEIVYAGKKLSNNL